MSKKMIVKNPLKAAEIPKASNKELPEYFWPEVFVYVSYCLKVRQSVLRQDFDADMGRADDLNDIRTWWSLKKMLVKIQIMRSHS